MEITGIQSPGLGDTSYLVTHEGQAVIIDPQRDIDRFTDAVEAANAELRFVVDTHIHNDYVSGGRLLADAAHADLVMPAGSGASYDFVPAFHGELIGGSALALKPLHTPGHTPEHTSYVLVIEGEPVAVFSGGSLLVMAAGRTDLLGMDRAYQLAKLQFASINRLAGLGDHIGLYPTHGEGSFCSASGAGRAISTIGTERTQSPVLQFTDPDVFAKAQIGGLQPYPSYYAQMGPINVAGGFPFPSLDIPRLSPEDVDPDDAIIDVRSRYRFSAGHIPGSIGLEHADNTGVWAGWLFPFNTPLTIVADPDQDVGEIVRQLGRIGFDHINGALIGLDTWVAAGLPLATCGTATADDLAEVVGTDAQILDVRAPDEWEAQRVPGSTHTYLPELVGLDTLPFDRAKPVWIVCRTGHRATAAAGLLTEMGFDAVIVSRGGVAETMAALTH